MRTRHVVARRARQPKLCSITAFMSWITQLSHTGPVHAKLIDLEDSGGETVRRNTYNISINSTGYKNIR